jgi:hypothetical protein
MYSSPTGAGRAADREAAGEQAAGPGPDRVPAGPEPLHRGTNGFCRAEAISAVLAEYEAHYNRRRPHHGRQLRPPWPDYPAADVPRERIKRRPVLGGLINEYERAG